ncbi:putative leader peptide [Streptomyces hyaluromycini]
MLLDGVFPPRLASRAVEKNSVLTARREVDLCRVASACCCHVR